MPTSPNNRPPADLDGATVICFASLDGLISAQRTVHAIQGEPVDQFASLVIAAYAGEDDYYLFYCDKNWSVVTDTMHPALDSAREQAEYEYPGVTGRWIDI